MNNQSHGVMLKGETQDSTQELLKLEDDQFHKIGGFAEGYTTEKTSNSMTVKGTDAANVVESAEFTEALKVENAVA